MHPLHRRLLGGSGAARWHMVAAVVLGVATAACVIAQALLLASMIGPAQVGVRVFELVFGHRYSIMRSAVFGSVMLPLAAELLTVGGCTGGRRGRISRCIGRQAPRWIAA